MDQAEFNLKKGDPNFKLISKKVTVCWGSMRN